MSFDWQDDVRKFHVRMAYDPGRSRTWHDEGYHSFCDRANY
jgi:hypothetical protein